MRPVTMSKSVRRMIGTRAARISRPRRRWREGSAARVYGCEVPPDCVGVMVSEIPGEPQVPDRAAEWGGLRV